MYPVMLLDPQPGEHVLDMCAAPGSKTMQIAGRMSQRGTIVANDRHINRMRSLRMNQERLGFINLTPRRAMRAAFFPDVIGSLTASWPMYPVPVRGNRAEVRWPAFQADRPKVSGPNLQ